MNRDLDIAVIGMSCRFPGARTVDELWANLEGGVESITRLSDEELRRSGLPPSTLASPSYVVRQLTTSLKAMATMLYSSAPVIAASMNVPRRNGRPVSLAGPRLVPLRLSKSTGMEGGSHEHAAE